MLSSLGWALSDMADAVVVGQRLGAVGLAAISLILPVYMINCMFAHGLGLGGSVRYSRLLGEGRTAEAADSFHGVFGLALLFSVATAVLMPGRSSVSCAFSGAAQPVTNAVSSSDSFT